MARVVLALLVLCSATVAAPVPKAKKPKEQPLEGRWRVLRTDSDGTGIVAQDLTWTVRAGELTVRRGDGPQSPTAKHTLVVPADGAADQIDWVVTYTGGESRTLPGVFTLNGDSLTLCLALKGDRPTECKDGKGLVLYTLIRAADEAK